MSTILYTLAEVYVNGKKLAEETSVKVTGSTKAQVVETVAKGFAGLSPGAKMLSISIDNGAPALDFELDPTQYMHELDVVELTIQAANHTLTTKGFFTDFSFSHAVNSPSTISFEFVGEWAKWQ